MLEYKNKQLVLAEYEIWKQGKKISIGAKSSFFFWLQSEKLHLLDFVKNDYAIFSITFHNDIP